MSKRKVNVSHRADVFHDVLHEIERLRITRQEEVRDRPYPLLKRFTQQELTDEAYPTYKSLPQNPKPKRRVRKSRSFFSPIVSICLVSLALVKVR